MSDVTRVNLWGFVNAYLVREDDGLTLVDTMLPQGAKRILAAADELGAPITRIALTHAHGDHIGSLDAVKAAFPDAEVVIGAREARLLEKDKTLEPGEPQTKVKGDYRGAKTKPTRTLAAGDHVGSLLVVASPGHTPGHVAYLDERDRTLFCGDAYSSLGGVSTSARLNPRFPLILMGTWNRPLVLEQRTLAARPRAGEPRPGPRQDRQLSARGDGRGDRARELSVPRQGLDTEQVVQAAVALADDGPRAGDVRAARRAPRRARAVALQPRQRARRAAATADAARPHRPRRRDRRGRRGPRRRGRAARDRARLPRLRAREPGQL